MRKFPTPSRRLMSAIVLFLSIAAIAITGTLAIYTSQVYQRAVVRNRDTEAVRFSSDKLYRVPITDGDAKKYYCPMSQGQRKLSFTVCNYDQSKKTVVNQQLLEYDIAICVKNGTADSYTIGGAGSGSLGNGETWSGSGSLPGGRLSSDTFTVFFSENDYNKVEVTVTVSPRDTSLTKGTKLYGTLIPIEYATTQGVRFSSEFSDSTTTNVGDVDAYNYSVSISGGESDVVITWDHTQLDIDPFFLEKMQAAGRELTTDGDSSKLTIHMNSDDETNSYHFPFYYHGGSKPCSWKDLKVSAELSPRVSAE